MTTNKLKVSNDIIAPAPATPAATAPAQIQPRSLVLIGIGINVLQEATVLIRQGWMPDVNMPPMVFGAAGTMQIIMVPGTPEQHFVNAAAVTLTEAAQREQGQYEKDVAAEAERRIEAKAVAEKLAQREALIAAQREALAALEAQ
jgi:hypothetical protein